VVGGQLKEGRNMKIKSMRMMAVVVMAVLIMTAAAMGREGRAVIGRVVAFISATPATKETAQPSAQSEGCD
jgi:hypothetical protein